MIYARTYLETWCDFVVGEIPYIKTKTVIYHYSVSLARRLRKHDLLNCNSITVGIIRTNDAAVNVSSRAHFNLNFTVVIILRVKNKKAKTAMIIVTSRYKRILFVGSSPHTAADILIKSAPDISTRSRMFDIVSSRT